MVVTWHFTHGPVALEGAPGFWPLSWLDEGHTGVALFMVLSGYLFAKLTEGYTLRYGRFLYNRAIRLLPLLLVVLAVGLVIHLLRGRPALPYLSQLAKGVISPSLPNGGWSITVEFHFYLLLPVLLAVGRADRCRKWGLPGLLAAAVLLKLGLHAWRGEVQTLSYWTLVGRIDQFLLGMILCGMRHRLQGRHLIAAATATAFAYVYWRFNTAGGFWRMPGYPSPSRWWVVLPAVEGLAYAVLVAWYDTSFKFSNAGMSGFIGRIGTWSYSIYLWHFFVVFDAARLVHHHVMWMPTFERALPWAVVFFLLSLPFAALSHRYLERPFLRFRTRYLVAISDEPTTARRLPDNALRAAAA